MSYLTDVAAAVWSYETRTLLEGSPESVVTTLDAISYYAWETHEPRTLSSGNEPGGMFLLG